MVNLIKVKKTKRKRNLFEKILFGCAVIVVAYITAITWFLGLLEGLGSDEKRK